MRGEEILQSSVSFFWRETGRTLKTSYPFTMHIPVVIVMSVSHDSGAPRSAWGKGGEIPLIRKSVCGCLIPCRERELPGYEDWIATSSAITGSRHNDTPVRS